MGCHSFLKGIFLMLGSNPGLPHCKQTLYHPSHQGSCIIDYTFIKTLNDGSKIARLVNMTTCQKGGPALTTHTPTDALVTRPHHTLCISFICNLSLQTCNLSYPTPVNWCVRVCSLSLVPFFVTPGLYSARLFCPWDSPGKNTGVGCHSLLQVNFPTLGWKSRVFCGSCIGRRIPYH